MLDEAVPQSVTFHLIKSPAFRTVHADGVWGGVTPRGGINIGFFSERGPFPRQVTYGVEATGRLGPEDANARVQRDGPVREIEVNVVLDLTLAKSLRAWLDEKILELEEAMRA